MRNLAKPSLAVRCVLKAQCLLDLQQRQWLGGPFQGLSSAGNASKIPRQQALGYDQRDHWNWSLENLP